MLGTRVTRARLTAATLVLAALAGATACATLERREYRDGYVMEYERGRNGVKLEVRDGDGTDDDDQLEFYLVPDTTCRVGDILAECADEDDFLEPRPGATPGLNPTTTARR
jgi:hypothetical protein